MVEINTIMYNNGRVYAVTEVLDINTKKIVKTEIEEITLPGKK